MNLVQCFEAIATAQGDGPIDWNAVESATKALTTPGSIDLTEPDQTAYKTDIQAARDAIRSTTHINFDLPDTIELQNRHHWIDANIPTISRILEPLDDTPIIAPTITSRLNTATFTTLLSFLANHVLGQYDPVLLSNTDDHRLYFVHPNITKTAQLLNVEYDRFRRWIVFHEVTHAAEFNAAPWLATHLETDLQTALDNLADGTIDRDSLHDLDNTMTVVEGYAEFTMDHAFDDTYEDLRATIDQHRRSKGPLATLLRRALGLGMKRRQYERGRAFFETINTHNPEITTRVWETPEHLPTPTELDNPTRWIDRITT